MKAQWFDAIPPVEAVQSHETYHARPDNLRLGRVTVDDPIAHGGRCVSADSESYGDWICHHHKSTLQSYVSCVRLKVVEGKVYQQSGFTSWTLLETFTSVKNLRFYPVGQDGLPTSETR